MLADPNAEAWLDGPLPLELPGAPLEPVAIPQAVPSGISQSGGIVTHRPGEAVDGKGSCLWSLYCASVSLGSFGPHLSAHLLVTGEPRSRGCDERQVCLGVLL